MDLRTEWLSGKKAFSLQLSGGNHKGLWPEATQQFLRASAGSRRSCALIGRDPLLT